MTGIPYLIELLHEQSIGICGISEHWLQPSNANILNSIDGDYVSYTKTVCSSNQLNGRSYGMGDVSIIWKKSLEKYIQTIEIDSDRIIAIKVCNSNISILVVQIYLPSSNHSLAECKDEVDLMDIRMNIDVVKLNSS